MTKAQAQVMKKWAKALRSGKYKQARGQLRKMGGYCCLGVLCDVVAPDGWGKCLGGYQHRGYTSVLGHGVMTDAGIGNVDESCFVTLNDERKATFEEIADVVDWIRMSDA